MSITRPDENIAYHAARLLVLIQYAGTRGTKSKPPAIEGRTRLAKLDFFLRYPAYLQRAAKLFGKVPSLPELGVTRDEELDTVESRMIRYRYGPWDEVYFPTLAYLIGKGLIQVDASNRTERFELTAQGLELAKKLGGSEEFSDLTLRAKTVYSLFNRMKGSAIKDFIYQHFPEVAGETSGKAL